MKGSRFCSAFTARMAVGLFAAFLAANRAIPVQKVYASFTERVDQRLDRLDLAAARINQGQRP